MSQNKTRLDQLLLDRQLCETRSQARALILAGKVLVNDVPFTKAGTMVGFDVSLRVKDASKYVSRGGLKLEKALQEFQINPSGKICLDVGASTGGFTDCLLQNGARKVFAVDVGYGQMHWKLQSDARVIRYDRQNFRYFDAVKITDPIDLCVIDVSFISLKLIIPKVAEIFSLQKPHKPPELIALIKPQFEVGREALGKGGIVKDEKARELVVQQIIDFAKANHFVDVKVISSPITGTDGNVEYLLGCRYNLA